MRKSTKAVQDIQQSATKKRPKTTKVQNAHSQTQQTTMTDNCLRSMFKRNRSPQMMPIALNTEGFCKGDQRDLGGSGQHKD